MYSPKITWAEEEEEEERRFLDALDLKTHSFELESYYAEVRGETENYEMQFACNGVNFMTVHYNVMTPVCVTGIVHPNVSMRRYNEVLKAVGFDCRFRNFGRTLQIDGQYRIERNSSMFAISMLGY